MHSEKRRRKNVRNAKKPGKQAFSGLDLQKNNPLELTAGIKSTIILNCTRGGIGAGLPFPQP
ncbi:MAG: hypothetical protein IJB41_03730, partial [Clostridia bacterium]|nr:hypothetical protein [Clostridia bacterium]